MAAVPAPLNKGPTTTKDPAGVGTSAGVGAGGGPATAETGTGTETLAPARWHDPKRYAWLLGLVVPTLPFLAWASSKPRDWASSGSWAVMVFGMFPMLDMVIGLDARNPPDSVLKWLEQDRYYRWCTYVFLPLQYAALVFACWLWATANLDVLEKSG